MVLAVLSFKSQVASECMVIRAEALACKTLDKMSQLQVLAEGLHRTVGSEPTRVPELFDAELIRVWSDITMAFLESEGSVREKIWSVPTVSLSKRLLMCRVHLQGPPMIRLRSFSLYDFSFLLTLSKCC